MMSGVKHWLKQPSPQMPKSVPKSALNLLT